MQHVRSLPIHHRLCADEESIDNPPRISKSLLPECQLLCLKLCRECTFDHMEYLLGQTSNLKSLHRCGWSHLTDAKKWQLLLSKCCPQLMKLELICTGYLCDEIFNDDVHLFEQESQPNSVWLERNAGIDVRERTGEVYHRDLTVQSEIGEPWIVNLLRF